MKTIDFSYFIERYNAGEMNETEKLWFEKELEGNRDLRDEVVLRKSTDRVLEDMDSMILRNKLRDIEKKRSERISVPHSGKNLIFRNAAVFAGFLMIASYFIFNGNSLSDDEIFNRYYKSYEITTASRSAEGITNSDYIMAMEYYNVHDYRNAALYFNKVLINDPKYIESTMLKGVSNFEGKNYPEAQISFSEVIEDNNNLFIEDARWYLALCHIKTNDMDKAVNQLKLIGKSESIYSRDARKILRRIK